MKAMVWALAVAAVGCGSSPGASTIDGGPTIAILAPAEGAMVSIATSSKVPLTFTVDGFTLVQPGACGSVEDACGHVHVLVDSDACNASGQNFNNIFPTAGAAISPATAIADLASCSMVGGAHELRLELHRDDHSGVTNGAAATVTITAGSTGGAEPDGGSTDASDGG